jgi:hypothetical protein
MVLIHDEMERAEALNAPRCRNLEVALMSL